MADNIETITAISNDLSYKDIFKFQLENLSSKDDLLITFSCSGNSKNIIEVIKFAKKKSIFTISFTGFANNKVKNLPDINFDIGVKNYGMCEDMFQSLMHMISQDIRNSFNNKKDIVL